MEGIDVVNVEVNEYRRIRVEPLRALKALTGLTERYLLPRLAQAPYVSARRRPSVPGAERSRRWWSNTRRPRMRPQ